MDSSNLAEVRRTLWTAADQLRANSTLAPNEYRGPVLGLIFLAYADIGGYVTYLLSDAGAGVRGQTIHLMVSCAGDRPAVADFPRRQARRAAGRARRRASRRDRAVLNRSFRETVSAGLAWV
jgi:hypothetical protein